MKYFEDISVGQARESTDVYELTADDIVGFCRQWDPLPFHVDVAAAEASPVGKLFTSAVHLVAIAIRLSYSLDSEPAATEIGLGWDEVRFHTPACVGDTLRARGEVIEARPSRSKPGLGIIRSRLALINQRDETVISFLASALVRRRPTG